MSALPAQTDSKDRKGPREESVATAARKFTSIHQVDLDAFLSSPLLAEGRINLIALDPVAERLGERWTVRRGQVYDQVERVLVRMLGPGGHFLRVSETDYLVAQPDVGPFGAQVLCLRALNEVLTFFLGPTAQADTAVHKVNRLNRSESMVEPVNHKAAAEGERREVQAAAAAAAARQDAETLLSPERWSPFIAASGQRVRVSCVLEPVFELKHHARIGYRLRRRVLDMATERPLSPQEIAHLSRADLLKIDMATISRGMARLNAAEDHEHELSLIVPASFVSLSHPQGRDVLSRAFAAARQTVEKGVICEVCDIEAVPQVALLSAVSLIRQSVLFVTGHLQGEKPQGIGSLKDTGLHALSIDCPQFSGDAEFIGWLRATLTAARKATRSLMLYGCDSPRRAALAAHLGVTHASFAQKV